jgi:hypothetical protein
MGRVMDVLSTGHDSAYGLGLRPERAAIIILGVTALGTAAAVSVSGSIGFVGTHGASYRPGDRRTVSPVPGGEVLVRGSLAHGGRRFDGPDGPMRPGKSLWASLRP